MSDRRAGRTRRTGPAALVVTLLANIEETWQEQMPKSTAADFIRLAQFERKLQETDPHAAVKELKVTWLKKPEESDSEE